jgi:hypothetical protein
MEGEALIQAYEREVLDLVDRELQRLDAGLRQGLQQDLGFAAGVSAARRVAAQEEFAHGREAEHLLGVLQLLRVDCLVHRRAAEDDRAQDPRPASWTDASLAGAA